MVCVLATCHMYGVCTVGCVECGMVCVLAACHRYGVCTVRTQHSQQYTHHTYDTLPHHHTSYNDVVFLPNLNLNITLARL